MIKIEESTRDNCFHLTKNSALTTVMIKSHNESSTNDDNKVKLREIDASLSKTPVEFPPEDLRAHLEPIIHRMIACEDSHPFRQSVDPFALNILDYPIIIKYRMDISTMHNQLLSGKFSNPLEFCDDVYLYI